MVRIPARIAAIAIAIAALTVFVALTVAPLAASKSRATGAPCKVAASSPVHVGTLFGGAVRGKGRFDCARGQKHASFAVILELKMRHGTRWVVPRTARTTYQAVVAGRKYTLAKSGPCFPASYRTRAVLTVGGRTMRAVSAVSKLTCAAAPGYGASCSVEAQTPANVNGQVVGTGTFKCSLSGPLDVNLYLEEFTGGRWDAVDEIHQLSLEAHGGTTYTFNTHPVSCPPPITGAMPQQYRTVMNISPINATITKTSPVVALC